MRHTREAIDRFLDRQASSGQCVAAFCAAHQLKVSTFYFWKKKDGGDITGSPSGFCQLMPVGEVVQRSLRLPSGLQLEITGLTMGQIAELLVEIDRAHA
jgi:hypothetical protein